jgi:hypothetical protein
VLFRKKSAIAEEARSHRQHEAGSLQSPITRAAGTDNPGSPDQLASRNSGNLVGNHFGLMAHVTGAAGEWDADAAVH